ncbi:MAG: tRNA guanosine(34) transglycosylase Tgt [Victivallales bacterium]|nr:tRNA guanosine(34) transglycosylase Tgt [Victivallales bacterium]
MSFKIICKCPDTRARRGVLSTPHGKVNTPVFMPVGTRASVKTMSPDDLKELGAEIILGNTYHLFLRPGMDIMAKAGGLHKFMSWDRPILTDSGGFQVFSLSKLRKLKHDGVEFASHIDGSKFFLGPKESMQIQRTLGSDVVMAFDECTPYPCSYRDAVKSLEITTRWESISRDQTLNDGQQLFGIVQGSVYEDLRIKSAEDLVKIGFDGYALGGLSVGEPEEDMFRCIDWVVPVLPEERPRYVMGVGTPKQLVEGVARGVDMFDCVIPTRLARHGSAYVSDGGTIPVKAGRYSDDFTPIDENCGCYTCRNFSKAYLRHLLNVGELLGMRLISYHNLYFFLNLMKQVREALENGTFQELRARFS